MYASGLGGAGKGETAQANYYNTYQNSLGDINKATTEQLRGYNTQINDAYTQAEANKLALAQQRAQNEASALFTNENLMLQQAAQDEAIRQYNQNQAYRLERDRIDDAYRERALRKQWGY